MFSSEISSDFFLLYLYVFYSHPSQNSLLNIFLMSPDGSCYLSSNSFFLSKISLPFSQDAFTYPHSALPPLNMVAAKASTKYLNSPYAPPPKKCLAIQIGTVVVFLNHLFCPPSPQSSKTFLPRFIPSPPPCNHSLQLLSSTYGP